jgi:hypothetical protein
LVGEAVEAILGVLALPEAGWEGEGVVADAGEGVARGGATGVSVAFTAGLVLTSSVSWDRGLTTCSAERGGASRSSSRAAGGALLEGLIRPPDLALSDRRLILGFSEAGLAKLNSPGSGCVAGI